VQSIIIFFTVCEPLIVADVRFIFNIIIILFDIVASYDIIASRVEIEREEAMLLIAIIIFLGFGAMFFAMSYDCCTDKFWWERKDGK